MLARGFDPCQRFVSVTAGKGRTRLKPIRAFFIAAAATVLLAAKQDDVPPAPPLPDDPDAPAASTGWQQQPGCAWRNHWTDSHHSAIALDWSDQGIALSLISDAFAGWSNDVAHPVQLDFGGADASVTVDAQATTGEGYAIVGVPFEPAVEQGLARDSWMRISMDGQSYVNLDMAGTAEAITAVKACAAAPHDTLEEGVDSD